MDMKNTAVSYLDPVLMDSRQLEQTQEVRIPDGMPDVDRILGVWGQPILRGKEWRADTVGFNGGMMLWIMYSPESNGAPEILDAWMPFQTKWRIPEDSPEGKLILSMGIRFLDARTISPRKLMVRCGLSVCMQALVPSETNVLFPQGLPEDVYVLRRSFPLKLYAQAGEKAFALEDTLSSTGEDLSDWRICSAAVRPYVNEQKVVGNKIAFRGAAELTVLFAAEDGMLENKSFVFPFSQFAELDKSFGNDAEADIQLSVTNLELEEDQEGVKQMKLGLTAQYAVTDMTMVDTAADAYSNLRPVKLTVDRLELNPILEKRWESLTGRTELPEDILSSIQTTLWSDVPVYDRDSGGTLETQGTVQILYKEDSGLEGKTFRWDGSKPMKAGEGAQVHITGFLPGQPQLEPGTGGMGVSGEVRCQITTFGTEGIPMVTDLELGEVQEQNPDRPSLILCRPGEKSLWELAKENGSTVEAIRSANSLDDEPAPNQMLLIPIA